MKTKQEILDFYTVEIGKKYRITKKTPFLESDIFSVEETTCNYGGLRLIFEGSNGGASSIASIALLTECDYEEYKPILDNTEREYLQKYVMDNPAFKGKVSTIHKSCFKEYDNITIVLTNGERLFLPRFKINSMYKNMNSFYSYTPQDLGLEE